MRDRLLRPSEEMRHSLETNIEAARKAEHKAAIKSKQEADDHLYLEQLHHAANIATSGPHKREINYKDITYTSTWVDWPRSHTDKGTLQVRLVRRDRITRKILGIPVGRYVSHVKAQLRLVATADRTGSDEETIVLFGQTTTKAPIGVYIPPADGKDNDILSWERVEVGSDDWNDVNELLKTTEAQLPKLTELTE